MDAELQTQEAPQKPEQQAVRRVDMTQGSLLRQTLALSWPVVGSFLLWILTGLADTKMVGSLGPDQIAAVGMSRSVWFIMLAGEMAISTGVQVLVAQYWGRGDRRGVDITTKQALIAGFVVTVLFITPVGMLVCGPLLRLLGASDAVLAHAVPYLRLLFAGTLVMVITFIANATLQGAGDTLTPLLVLLVANAVNIGGNYLFIFGVGPCPQMGVTGAAVGTVLAHVFTAVVGLAILFSGRFAASVNWRGSWAFQWPVLQRILYIGLPAGVEEVIRDVGFMALLKVLSMTGGAMYAISAFTIAGQIRMVTGMVGLGLMVSATTAVGQNCGARNHARAAKAGWLMAGMAASASIVSAITYFILAPRLIGFFSADPEVIRIGTQALRALAVSEPLMTASMCLSGALRGGGDTYAPLCVVILTSLLVVPALAYVLSQVAGLDTLGVWIAIDTSIVLGAIILGIRFKQGKWRSLNVAAAHT